MKNSQRRRRRKRRRRKAVRIYSQNIEMEFGMKKSERSEKKGNLHVFGNIESGNERKIKKKASQENEKTTRNLIKRINPWALPLVRYSGLYLKWTREEFQQRDQKTRMMVHKVLHPRVDIDRQWVSRKEWWRELTSIQDSVDASIRRLEDYLKKEQRKTNYSNQNDTNNTRINRTTITRK